MTYLTLSSNLFPMPFHIVILKIMITFCGCISKNGKDKQQQQQITINVPLLDQTNKTLSSCLLILLFFFSLLPINPLSFDYLFCRMRIVYKFKKKTNDTKQGIIKLITMKIFERFFWKR